jgi:hypothetical protein
MARLAAAAISSGVCQVPGWGRRLGPGRVLGERAELGLPVALTREQHEAGYERWLVLEQDVAITGPEPAVESGPALDVRKSIEFLSIRAPRREVSHT